jgi:SAM-dependent methyltransferase
MNSQQNWYKTFFNGLALEVWTKVMTPEYTNAEIQLIKTFVDRTSGANILDIPCGNGRHSIALAQEGYCVTSIDIAEEYISALRNVTDEMKLPVTAICADILEYELSGEFDLALCLGNSFNYFDYCQLLQFAKKVNRVLKKGGFS